MPPPRDRKKQSSDVMTGHLRAMIANSSPEPDPKMGAMENDTQKMALARASFMLQRKRDALNCYLRTVCMRVSGDLVQ